MTIYSNIIATIDIRFDDGTGYSLSLDIRDYWAACDIADLILPAYMPEVLAWCEKHGEKPPMSADGLFMLAAQVTGLCDDCNRLEHAWHALDFTGFRAYITALPHVAECTISLRRVPELENQSDEKLHPTDPALMVETGIDA